MATEIAIVDAKSKVLDNYDRQLETVLDNVDVIGNGKINENTEGKTEQSQVSNIKSVLNVNSPCFIPGVVTNGHTNDNAGFDGKTHDDNGNGNDNGTDMHYLQAVNCLHVNADACHDAMVPLTVQSCNSHHISGEPETSKQSGDALLSVIRQMKKNNPTFQWRTS